MKRVKTAKRKLHRMLFKPLEGQEMIAFTLRYRDGKTPIEVTLTELDALRGKPGNSGECLMSQACLRLAAKFPHPVHFVETTDTRVWVVDKMKNHTPISCVRYTLSNTTARIIKFFDTPEGRRKLRESLVLRARTIRLLPPTNSVKTLRAPTGPHAGLHTGKQPSKKPIPRGSYARLLRTGAIQLPASA